MFDFACNIWGCMVKYGYRLRESIKNEIGVGCELWEEQYYVRIVNLPLMKIY